MATLVAELVAASMVYMCEFCKRALFEDDEQKGRRKDGKLKLTGDNLPACKLLLKRAWRLRTSTAAPPRSIGPTANRGQDVRHRR